MIINEVVQFLKEIQYRHGTQVNKNEGEHAGRFESISNFQTKTEFYFQNFVSAKDGKQGEKVRASLPPPRSHFPQKIQNLNFDTIFTVFVKSPLKRLFTIF